jgi:3-phenylpropionate/trans-cinnamate dioxygenase ferredoxin reductase subunit
MADPVVIVGAGMAGLRAAEQLRAAGWEGPVTVIGEETHAPYNRPPLSKEALAGAADKPLHEVHASLAFRQRASVADVTWRLGTRVTGCDMDSRTVTLADETVLDYGGLVIATGLRPRRLRLSGPTVGRSALRTLDDAYALAPRLRAGARVVVIGGGFIGCEIAATAIGLGCAVTVVEPAPAPLATALGPEVGAAVQAFHERRGITFCTERKVVALTGDEAVSGVVLDDDSVLEADVVVEAVGSEPNVEWLAGNELDLSDGVLCDAQLRVVGRSDVVAVGDVARYPNLRFDDVPRRVEHWCTPTDTAKQAARTLVAQLRGTPATGACTAMPSFWSDQHGLRIQGFGLPRLADDVRVVTGDLDRVEDGVIVHYHRGERLVAALLVGIHASQHRAHRDLVEAANPLPTDDKLQTSVLKGVPA